MENNNNETRRVLLWSTPRSASTTFLKSMSNLENGVFWHEPYTQAFKFGSTKSSRRLARKGKTSKPSDVPGKNTDEGGFVYDASKITLTWVKHELERESEEKSLVLVKEIINGSLEDYYEWIPGGYHHTFLIRHPHRICMSLMGLLQDVKSKKIKADLERKIPQQLQSFSKMCDLLEYIKVHHDEKPLIIDCDDLLSNPIGIMQAYCKDIGVQFVPDILHWETGDAVMKNRWFVSKQNIATYKAGKLYESSFASTGFQQPSDLPLRLDLPDELLPLVDSQMPYYEQLYEQAIKCYMYTPLKE